ncbi:wax ester synthase/diacylglycerol acyltransferase 11-like [Cryptomeria japonica]|uniref:wax ester synthase/diacylglycerol acyltransferase 11-like n=1 Tax=Cryptomeria japonica TaxID=3369 RepID=UPI0027DA0E59|nr:wax ester synthase/diacylglycerol acyltransferase 11-like [Cryptomeria japonica]
MEAGMPVHGSASWSVNDVIMGVVFCGFRRYYPNQIENLRVTALVLMNSISQPGLKNLEEMTKSRTKSPWGNRWGFLQLSVPMDGLENPLEYILRAKRMADRKKMLLAVNITRKVISYITRVGGPKRRCRWWDTNLEVGIFQCQAFHVK